MSATDRVRLAVIGLGLIAQAVHLPNLRNLRERFDVTHMCDLSAGLARQIASEWGGPVTTSTDPADVFADPEVDAVLLLTPGSHAALAEAALRAGKHVLAEKPFSHSAGEAISCADLADERGLVLQVGYMKMYEPVLERTRAELARLGDIKLVRVTVLHPADDHQISHVRQVRYGDADPAAIAAADADEDRRLALAVGSVPEPFRSVYRDVLQGSVCHELSLLRALFGGLSPAFSWAQVGTTPIGAKLPEPPQIQALGTLDGSQFALSWNWLPDYPEYEEEVAVFGSAGRLSLHMPAPYTLRARAVLEVERPDGAERTFSRMVGEPRTGFEAELCAFHAAVTQGEPVVSSARGAARDCTALQQLLWRLAAGHHLADSVGGEAAASSEAAR